VDQQIGGDDSGFGVMHTGRAAIDDLPRLIRRMREGRAFVLVDRSSGREGRRYVERALSDARMPVQFIEVSNAIHIAGQHAELARRLAGSTGALVTVGGSALIDAGKSVAALATSGHLVHTPMKDGLPVAPRTHLAIPVDLGPPVEATSLVIVDQRTHRMIIDERTPALAVIDDRLFPESHPAADDFRVRVIAMAACIVTDVSAALRNHTLALAAAHQLNKPVVRPVDIRIALTLAAAGHRQWPLCRRCKAGTLMAPEVRIRDTSSPVLLCLQQAIARGGNDWDRFLPKR
jgi:hypothetical protein